MQLFNKKISEIDLVPILVLSVIFSTILLVPSKIVGYGYLPPDDALRHSAKVVSGKTWDDILVLRDEVKMDTHPGWHAILGAIHKFTSCSRDSLVLFSIFFFFLIFSLIPLFMLERPEAWIVSLVVINVANYSILIRLFSGRPYIFPMAFVLFLCLSWRKFRDKKMPYMTLLISALLATLSTWIHCAWYILFLPVICFFMAREWRGGTRLFVSIIIGTMIGASLTGQPHIFIKQTLIHGFRVFGNHSLQRMLVGELKPFTGDSSIVIVTFAMILWSKIRGAWNKNRIDNPIFILVLTGWALGFISRRFWLDWGFPALSIWMALEFQDALKENIDFKSFRRLILTVFITGILYVSLTSDINDRWTENLTREYLSLENPEHKEWLPEKDGIVYSDSMRIFYDIFFTNPSAPWRYILGFESTMMPKEDLEIYRKIQWNFGADEAFYPWVKKMKPEDRLILGRGKNTPPRIPELEWHYAATGIWIGRLPK